MAEKFSGGGRGGLSRGTQARLQRAFAANPDMISDPRESVRRLNSAIRRGELRFNADVLNGLTDRQIANTSLTALGRLSTRQSNAALRDLGAGLRANNPDAISAMQRFLRGR